MKDPRDFGKSTGYHVHNEDIEYVLSGDIVRLQHKAVDRALSLAQPPGSARILVQGCGTGTEGVYLTKLGYDVVGVDILEHQRRVAHWSVSFSRQ
jgi:SAM-dependent methyltransferase